MSWNYRVMRSTNPDGTPVFAIHEMYYAEDGWAVTAWTENASHPQGDSFKELTEDFTNYQAAFQRPVIADDGDRLVEVGPMGNAKADRQRIVYERRR